MKKYSRLIFILLFSSLFSASAQIRSNRDLIGKWQGDDHGDHLELEFFADSKVMITAPGGRLPLATYRADFNKMPIEVTLTATDNGKQMSFKGQMDFLDNETIKFTYFGDSKRHDAFAQGRSITMKKTK